MDVLVVVDKIWFIPGFVIIAMFAVVVRWNIALTKRMREQGERIARLEGRLHE